MPDEWLERAAEQLGLLLSLPGQPGADEIEVIREVLGLLAHAGMSGGRMKPGGERSA